MGAPCALQAGNRLPPEFSRKALRTRLRPAGNVFKDAIQALARKATGWMASQVYAFFLAAQGKLNSFLFFDPIINQQVRVRFDTDQFDLKIEPSQVADSKPIVSWNSLVLIEVRPPNY